MKHYYLIKNGSARYNGRCNDAVEFTMKHQLMKKEVWKSFTDVYKTDSDSVDLGWRNEYWGKMMRGACLTYMYNGDSELYDVIENSVRNLICVHPSDGVLTTYCEEKRFSGWDMWGRKYVLTGLQHFLKICKDESFKEEIYKVMRVQADDIIKNIGYEDGKKRINTTSNFWYGVNSSSVLEPFVELYSVTKEQKYIDFAEYIISEGGCSEGDLALLATEDKLKPFQYPETKAYETMSYFEGLLAYYEITGKTYYLEAVKRFADAVAETDITVIGCSGCTHELFDNSVLKQTEYSDGIMQETCVSVTWMRLNARLFLLTGEEKYFARIEKTGYNALYGAMNTKELKQLDMGSKELLSPLPFDSYSPLFNNKRGRGIGGLKRFSFGGHYGCCACIASAGIALVPLLSVVKDDKGFVFSGYPSGCISESLSDGDSCRFEITSDYPAGMNVRISVALNKPESFGVKLRLPVFCDNYSVCINGVKKEFESEDGYVFFDRVWADNDVITIKADAVLKHQIINDKISFSLGAYVLCADCEKEEKTDDLSFQVDRTLSDKAVMLKPEKDEYVRMLLPVNSEKSVFLTDYASCGKNWNGKRPIISVWFNMK